MSDEVKPKKGKLDRLVHRLYDIPAGAMGIRTPEERQAYHEALDGNRGLMLGALALDGADLVPVVSQISMAADAVAAKGIHDYGKSRTEGQYQMSKTWAATGGASEVIGALIPGFPLELVPTTFLLYADAAAQIARHELYGSTQRRRGNGV